MNADKIMDKGTKDKYIQQQAEQAFQMIPKRPIPFDIKSQDIHNDDGGYVRPHNYIHIISEKSPVNQTMNSEGKELPKSKKETAVSAKGISVNILSSNEIYDGDRGQINEHNLGKDYNLKNEPFNHGSKLNDNVQEQNTFKMWRLSRNAATNIYDRVTKPRPDIDVSIGEQAEWTGTLKVVPSNTNKNGKEKKELSTISKSISTEPHEMGIHMSDDLPRLPLNREVIRCKLRMKHILIGACTSIGVMMVLAGIGFVAYYSTLSNTDNSSGNATDTNAVAMDINDNAVTTYNVTLTTNDVVPVTTHDDECFNFKAKCIRFNKQIRAVYDEIARDELVRASGAGNIMLVCKLLKCGVSANSLDTKGHTPLGRASQKGNVKVAQLLLTYNASVNKANRVGSAPLHIASKYGHTEVVKLLVAYKASVDKVGRYMSTPLNIASHFGHTEVAKLLLTYNASVNKS